MGLTTARKPALLLLVASFTSAALLAQGFREEIPLKRAPAPSLEEAARAINAARTAGKTALGQTPNTHIISPNALIFQPLVTPCRMVDTRNTAGVTETYGGPIFASGEIRTYDFVNALCYSDFSSFPTNVLAWYVNITVTGTTSGPSFLTAYPNGITRPLVATVNWPSAGAQVNNSVIAPGDSAGLFNVYVGSSTHVIIDLVGIFINNMSDRGDQLFIDTSRGGAAAILGQNDSSLDGSHGVGGYESGTGRVFGVQGQIGSGANTDSAGVHGIGAATTPRSYGVLGEGFSAAGDSAGVKGIGQTGEPAGAFAGFIDSGVRGDSVSIGVLGVANFLGTVGAGFNGSGTEVAEGWVGYNTGGGTNYGLLSALGDIGCFGCTKSFLEPHPTDPARVIRFVSLEGNEAGTYFRGTARTVGGKAVIVVPEEFRMVSEAEELTVQLTPIGELATMAVMSEDLNQIVVRSSKDVTFHYLVHGIHLGYRDYQAGYEGREFMPQSSSARMKEGWPEHLKQRLIANGTYKEDGTINLDTAKRLGWDKVWAAAREKQLQPAAATPGN